LIFLTFSSAIFIIGQFIGINMHKISILE
jgi:hypothetical protein